MTAETVLHDFDGELGQEPLLEQDHVDEPVVEGRLGGEPEPAAVAPGIREPRSEPTK